MSPRSLLPPPPDVEAIMSVTAADLGRADGFPDRPWVPVEVLEAHGKQRFWRGYLCGLSTLWALYCLRGIFDLLLRWLG